MTAEARTSVISAHRTEALSDRLTVRQLEAGVTDPRRATLDVVRRAFEAAGVEFIDEYGNRGGQKL